MDAVAPGCLGLVQRIVGHHGGLVEAFVTGMAAGDAATDRQPDLAARAAYRDLVDRVANPFGDEVGAGWRGVRQEQAELVAPGAGEDVLFAQVLGSDGDDALRQFDFHGNPSAAVFEHFQKGER